MAGLYQAFFCLLTLLLLAQYLVYTSRGASALQSSSLRRGLEPGASPAAPDLPSGIAAATAESWGAVAPLQGQPLAAASTASSASSAALPAAKRQVLIPNVQLPARQGAGQQQQPPASAAGVVAGPAPAPYRHGARDFFCENRAPPGSSTAPDSSSMAAYIASGGRFPIALITCNRAAQLERTLADLLAVRCVLPSDITVVADSCSGSEAIAGLAAQAGVAYHLHARALPMPGEDGAARIASHYGYALAHMLSTPAAPPALLIVEDDMAFAPDFYEYFHAVAGLLEADDTLWLASAWNDNGFDYLVADPLALRRTRYFPGLGWLLPRAVWQGQLAAGWPGSHWDHWLRDPAQHRGRDVLYPELPRDYHMGVQGTFMDTGTHNRYFGSIALASDAAFTWDTPEGAASIEGSALEAYEEALAAAVSGSGVTHLRSVADIAAFSSGVGVVWYSCSCAEPDHASMRPLAAYFGIWHEGARGSREGVHALWWLGSAKLYLVNVGLAGGFSYAGAGGLNGAVEVAPPWLTELMPAAVVPLSPGDFVGASRPVLPQHKAVYGAQWRTPLAHLEGGHDGNGQAESGLGGGEVAVVAVGEGEGGSRGRRGRRSGEGEGEAEAHVHSQFMGDFRASVVAGGLAGGKRRARGGGKVAGGSSSSSSVARIGLMPSGSVVVAAEQPGQNCDAVCRAYSGGSGSGSGSGSFACAARLLPLVNTCESLREQYKCSFCQDSAGGDLPAYVALAAPASKLPGACLVNKDAKLFSCEASWEHTQRLCTCVSSAAAAM